MPPPTFKALLVTEQPDGQFLRHIAQRSMDDLPPGEVLINVKFSSLNYKDALSATGHKGVTRAYPHTPGIDAAGTVEESRDPRFQKGDQVIVTGYDLGMNTPGGFAQYIRVPGSWVIALPAGLSLKESMIYGTAGLTAAMCVSKLQQNGLVPSQGEVFVTGATGGVGSMAVGLLSRLGHQVVAVTGKREEHEYLQKLGAGQVMSREDFCQGPDKPLLKMRWAGGIDTVGGEILTTALKSLQYGAGIACCGMVASPELSTTIYPLILRGNNLLGVASAECPLETKRDLWQKIAGAWKVPRLNDIATECPLAGLEEKIQQILKGALRGRVVVKLEAP